jgi:hypothetical protein
MVPADGLTSCLEPVNRKTSTAPGFSSTAIDAPLKALAAALEQRGVDPATFLVPDVGETLSLP